MAISTVTELTVVGLSGFVKSFRYHASHDALAPEGLHPPQADRLPGAGHSR